MVTATGPATTGAGAGDPVGAGEVDGAEPELGATASGVLLELDEEVSLLPGDDGDVVVMVAPPVTPSVPGVLGADAGGCSTVAGGGVLAPGSA